MSITQDATSGWYVPASYTEWQALLSGTNVPPPQSLWGMQDAAGNVTDAIGTSPLVNAGGGTYQNAVTGWTRKALQATNSNRWITGSFAAGLSIAVLGIVQISGNPTSNSELFGTGNTRANVTTLGTLLACDNTAAVSGAAQLGTTVHPVLVVVDTTKNRCMVVSDQESQINYYSVPATQNIVVYGGYQTPVAGETTSYLYGAAWTGPSAEFTPAQAQSIINAIKFGPVTTAITTDTTSGWYVPASLNEWNNLLAETNISSPGNIWTCQETTGNLGDAIGNNLMHPNGNVLYSQPVTGWNRVGVKAAIDNTTTVFSGTCPDVSVSSSLLLQIVSINTNPVSSTRALNSMGTTTTMEAQLIHGPFLQAEDNANVLAGTAVKSGVLAVVTKLDLHNQTMAVYSHDGAVLKPTYFAPFSSKILDILGDGFQGSDATLMYAAFWSGSAAEMSDAEIQVLFQRVHWGPMPVTRDLASRYYTPYSAWEWKKLLAGSGLPVPQQTWTLQEDSQATPTSYDMIGDAHLSVIGVVTPRLSVPGWNRFAMSPTENLPYYLYNNNSPNLSDGSTIPFTFLMYAAVTSSLATTATGGLDIAIIGDGNGQKLMVTGSGGGIVPKLVINGNGTLATATGASALGTTVHPFVLRSDGGITPVFNKLQDDLETVAPTATRGNSSTKVVFIGGPVENSIGTKYLYAAQWVGKAMNDQECANLINIVKNGPMSNEMPSVGSGAPADLMATRDATSGIYLPQNWTEWQAVLTGSGLTGSNAPFSLWTCQDVTGNLSDNFAANNATVTTTVGSPGYQQSLAGWTTKGVTFPNGGFITFEASAGTVPSGATTSGLFLAYLSLSGTQVANTSVLSFSRNGSNLGVATMATSASPSYIGFDSATSATGSKVPTNGTMHPVVMRCDHTNSVFKIYTDQEIIVLPYTAPSNNTNCALGGQLGQFTSAGFFCNYWVGFKGAAAELSDNQVRALLQTLGWDVKYWPQLSSLSVSPNNNSVDTDGFAVMKVLP